MPERVYLGLFFVLFGGVPFLASVLNWQWFFRMRRTQFWSSIAIRLFGERAGRWLFGLVGAAIMIYGAAWSLGLVG